MWEVRWLDHIMDSCLSVISWVPAVWKSWGWTVGHQNEWDTVPLYLGTSPEGGRICAQAKQTHLECKVEGITQGILVFSELGHTSCPAEALALLCSFLFKFLVALYTFFFAYLIIQYREQQWLWYSMIWNKDWLCQKLSVAFTLTKWEHWQLIGHRQA